MSDTAHHNHPAHLLAAPRLAVSALRHLWSSDVNEAAVERLQPEPGDQVVDIGSGFGPATAMLADRVKPTGRVIAVDPSRILRTVLRARLALSARRKVVQPIDGTAESLPLASDSADKVLSLNVMHHMDDLERAAIELYRVMKPGSRLLLIDEDFDDDRHSYHQAAGGHHHGPELVDPDHVVRLLTAAGFDDAAATHEMIGGEPAYIVSANIS